MESNQIYQRVVFGDEARPAILPGAKKLAEAVGSTMGPSGKNVVIDIKEGYVPVITKDGVTVAKSIKLKDRLESVGAELLKQIATKTNETAGDGTTSATVLGYNILAEGIKMISSKYSSTGMKRGMDLASKKVIDYLKTNATQVSDKSSIASVGTISANGDKQIGELLATAIERVGKDGIITIEPARSVNTSLEFVDGMQIESGYLSPYFITNQEKLTCELENPFVLVTNRKISSLKELLPLLEEVFNQKRQLLVIADEIESEAMQTLIVNKMKKTLVCCAIKAPLYGEKRNDLLNDIALVTGATMLDVSNPTKTEKANSSMLGTAKKIIVSKHLATIIGDGKQQANINEKTKQLKALIENDTASTDETLLAHTKMRLAKLVGGVAVIKVGGSTEVEILEKKDRVEDALNATQAAAQEGIVPGGGLALFNASRFIKKPETLTDPDEIAGWNVVMAACQAPLKTIVKNTGRNEEVVISKLLEWNDVILYSSEEEKQAAKLRYGYDAYNHKFCDLVKNGIIDPVRVPRCALEYATSIVSLLLTADAIVCNEG